MKSYKFAAIPVAVLFAILSGCNNSHRDEVPHVAHKIVATMVRSAPVTISQKYVCQIHSRRHIEVRALERGYLEQIKVKEGQPVNEGDEMFKVIPRIYQAKLDAQLAEQDLAQKEYNFSKQLSEDKVVSNNEVLLKQARLSKAAATAEVAKAELNFATIRAPFDGIVDRLHHQQGSLVEEGDTLTTLSDNSVMWVYFNVPESGYLEYMTEMEQHHADLKVELVLADNRKFTHVGHIAAIEADFNNQTGNIAFRADFPNPEHLLRNGQTGTVVISRVQNDAIVIPQRAAFPILDRWYVYIIDDQNIAHQREIRLGNELEDIFVVKSGIDVNEKILLEGIRQVHDGEKVEYDEVDANQVIAHLKYHAE